MTSTRSGVKELQEFQSQWRDPDMRDVWERFDSDVQAAGGVLLQPTGMWEVDYNRLRRELVERQRGEEEEKMLEVEDGEKKRVREEGVDWRGVVERFEKRMDGSGVRVVIGRNDASVTVALVKTGIVFDVRMLPRSDDREDELPDWRVSQKPVPGRPTTKLESSILECLNSRPRQWDLGYLLVSSWLPVYVYASI